MRTIRSPLIAQDAAASLTSGHLLHLNPPYDQAAWAALPSPSCDGGGCPHVPPEALGTPAASLLQF